MLALYTAPRAVGRRFELSGRGLWSKYASAGALEAQKLHHADVIDKLVQQAEAIELAEIGMLFSPLEQSKRRGRALVAKKGANRCELEKSAGFA